MTTVLWLVWTGDQKREDIQLTHEETREVAIALQMANVGVWFRTQLALLISHQPISQQANLPIRKDPSQEHSSLQIPNIMLSLAQFNSRTHLSVKSKSRTHLTSTIADQTSEPQFRLFDRFRKWVGS